MKRDCPCHSGQSYAACCEPFHTGAREAPSPETLMRSRYSAYALGLGAYLVHTLAASHVDQQLPRQILEAALSKVVRRFAGLRIILSRSDGDHGEVLFVARIYDRGADVSFGELSQFVREGEAWRYAEGVTVSRGRLPKQLRALTREAFLTLAEPALSPRGLGAGEKLRT